MPEQSEVPIPDQERKSVAEDKPENPGRRNFLKGLAGFIGLKAVEQTPIAQGAEALTQTAQENKKPEEQKLQGSLPPIAVEEKEKQPFSRKVTIIDMAPSEAKEGYIHKTKVISNDELVEKLLAGKQLTDEYESKEFVKGFLKSYFAHGENVANVFWNVWKTGGEVRLNPLQDALDSMSLQFLDNDELGNPRARFTILPGKIIDLLENDPNKVVNMSFQIGDVGLKATKYYKGASEEKTVKIMQKYESMSRGNVWSFYSEDPNEKNHYADYDPEQSDPDNRIFRNKNGDEILPITQEEYEKIKKEREGKLFKEQSKEIMALPQDEIVENSQPGISIRGAYAREKAQENLPKLFEVCDAYPDKLFVVAIGNEGEDIRDALQILQQRPDNLIIVGQWGRDTNPDVPTWDTYGADIYVDNTKHNLKMGSSFSTPFISAYASILFEKRMSMDEVKRRIFDASEMHTFKDKVGVTQSARVFNPDKIDGL